MKRQLVLPYTCRSVMLAMSWNARVRPYARSRQNQVSCGRRLETQRNQPTVSKVNAVPSPGAVLSPHNLRDANVCHADLPGRTFAADKGVRNPRLGCSQTYNCFGRDAQATFFDDGHLSYIVDFRQRTKPSENMSGKKPTIRCRQPGGNIDRQCLQITSVHPGDHLKRNRLHLGA